MHHREWYIEALVKAEKVGTTPCMPRIVARQSQRNNVPATSSEEYYRRSVTIPFLDHILLEMNSR